jgi:hypothetical protein
MVNKLPILHSTRSFITMFITTCQWTPFWPRWLQSTPSHFIL